MVFKIRRKTPAGPASDPTPEVLDAGEFGRGLIQVERPVLPGEVYEAPVHEPSYLAAEGASSPHEEFSSYSAEPAGAAPTYQGWAPGEAAATTWQVDDQYAATHGGQQEELQAGHYEPAYSTQDGNTPGPGIDDGGSQLHSNSPMAGGDAIGEATDLYAADPVAISPKTKRRGLFGLKRAEAAALRSKKEGKAKRARPALAPRSVVLQISMRDLHGTFLQVSEDSVAPADGPIAQSIRVSEMDHHLALPGKRSRREAMDHAIATIGAQATILFPTDRSDSTFFAAPLDEIRQVDHPCAPIQAAVLTLLQQRFPGKSGCVAVLSLVDQASGATTLLLFHRMDTGLLREPYVVLRSDDLQMDLNSFYENRQVPLADRDRVAVFNNADLLTAAADLRTYPRDRTFAGIGASTLLSLASVVGVAVTVLSTGYAATVYLSWHKADTALRAERSKNARLSTELSRLIEGSVQSYAKLANLDVLPSLDLLEKLHSPGSVGTVKLDRNSGVVLEYTLPLNRSGTSNNTTSNTLTSLETIAAFREKPAPEGCTKAPLALTEGGNVLKASFVCQVDSGNFGRHRLD